MRNVTVRHAVSIAASPERVWDVTQDWSRRTQWDATIVSAEAIESATPSYRVRGAGGLSFIARYKLYDRPRRTSLEMVELNSRFVIGGGGSWAYEAEGAGTRWTQTNTIALRDGLLGAILKPLVRWRLSTETRRAMEKAKALIERG
jgi:hypothetical protein